MRKPGSENDASTARTSPVAISNPAPALASFCGGLFLVEHVLGFDGHVHHVGRVVVEFEVCEMSEQVETERRWIGSKMGLTRDEGANNQRHQ